MSYQTTKKADEDIIGIYVHGVKEFGLVQAEKYHASLEKVFLLLNATPEMARERAEFKPPVRIHFHEAHVIVYTKAAENILILRVISSRQDWEQILT